MQIRQEVTERENGPLLADDFTHVAHQFLQAVGLGAAQVVGLAKRGGVIEAVDEGARHVFHVYRRKARVRCCQRQHREQLQQAGKQGQESIAATEDDGRTEQSDVEAITMNELGPVQIPALVFAVLHSGLAHQRFGNALGALVSRAGIGVGAQRAHVQQPRHARFATGVNDLARQLNMNFMEITPALTGQVCTPNLAFVQDAD